MSRTHFIGPIALGPRPESPNIIIWTSERDTPPSDPEHLQNPHFETRAPGADDLCITAAGMIYRAGFIAPDGTVTWEREYTGIAGTDLKQPFNNIQQVVSIVETVVSGTWTINYDLSTPADVYLFEQPIGGPATIYLQDVPYQNDAIYLTLIFNPFGEPVTFDGDSTISYRWTSTVDGSAPNFDERNSWIIVDLKIIRGIAYATERVQFSDPTHPTATTNPHQVTAAQAGALPVDVDRTTEATPYTLKAGNAGQLVELTGTGIVTLPDGLDADTQIVLINIDAGAIPLSATNLRHAGGGTQIANQWEAVTVYHRGAGEWVAIGDLI